MQRESQAFPRVEKVHGLHTREEGETVCLAVVNVLFVPLGLLGERRVQGEVEKSRGGEGEAR